MQKNRLLILLNLIYLSSVSQNVKIEGIAADYKGKEVSIYVYDDLITKTRIKESSDTVDTNGKFFLNLEVKTTQLAIIKINNVAGKIYIQPFFQYGIIFPAPDTANYNSINTEEPVDIEIVGDSMELNARVIDFNIQYDTFWRKNYKYFVAHRMKQALDTFKVSCEKRYAKVKSNYFHTYVDYTFATLYENTGLYHAELAKRYLLHKPIHYHNYEYMDFFNQFYKMYLHARTGSKQGNEIIEQVIYTGDYNALSFALKKDPYLFDDTLRELVILKSMYEMYYLPKYNKEKIISIVEQIHQKTKIKEHQHIASNIIKVFRNLQAGSLAPEFKLKTLSGNEVNLNDFKDRYIYLHFFNTGSLISLQEMKKMEQVKNKYDDKIIFISICIDNTPEELAAFLKKNPKYNWYILSDAEDKSVKERYNVKAVPTYYLINREGYLVQSPAASPGDGIELKFKEMFRTKKR